MRNGRKYTKRGRDWNQGFVFLLQNLRVKAKPNRNWKRYFRCLLRQAGKREAENM